MRKILMLLPMLVLSVLAFAQTRELTGTVVDPKGSPIPAATIRIRGSRGGTSSDANGAFHLRVPAHAVLLISGVGYQTQEYTVNETDNVTISLKQTDANLSEVVVTALGIKRDKRLLTYSQQTVTGNTLVEAKQDNVVNALSGRVAGVQVTNSSGMPGSSTRITIRGISSLNGENQALFVIDGIPMDAEEAGNPDNSLFAGGTVSRSNDIDPNIIESITVLKGAAATALYGSSAARGAILITTKGGHGLGNGGKPTVTFSSSYSFIDPIFPKIQDKFAQGSGGKYVNGNAGQLGSASFGPEIDTLKVNGAPVQKYNPLKMFFKEGHTSDNNISVSGYGDKSNYLVSYSYLKTDGTEPTTNYDRHSLFFKYGTRLLNNLNLTTQFNYIHTDNHRLLEGDGLNNPLWTVYSGPISWNPFPTTNPDGTQRVYRAARNNPYWIVDNTGLDDVTDRILPTVNINYNPLPWLSLTERFGGDMYWNTTDYHENIGIIGSTSPNGKLWKRDNKNIGLNHDFIIEAKKDISDKLSGDFIVGNNILSNYNNSNFVEGVSLSIPNFYNISNAQNVTSNYAYYNKRRVGFYGQATFEYMKMLILNGTVRYDGTSVLSSNKQFYPYGSGSIGFIFTEPLKMETNPILNYGKVRVSYSGVGNDNVGPYQLSIPYSQTTIGNVAYPVNGTNGFQLSSTYAFNLQNESLKEFETGIETKWFQNRASLDVTYFDRKSTKLLTTGTPWAPATGFSSVNITAGDMYNKGVEVVLGFTPVKTRDLTWNVSVNWTKIKNMVTRLAPGLTNIQFAGFTDPGIFAFAGKPYGVIYGSQFLRDSATHKLLLDDNGYPQESNVSGPIGNVQPNWLGGLTSDLFYKGFSFSFTLDMKQGGQILNLDDHYLNFYGTTKPTEQRGQLHLFDGIIQSTGKPNTTPVPLTQAWYQGVYSTTSESSVEDASYLKLRQASLAYSFTNGLIKKGGPVKSLVLSVTATNFILHKNYLGSDPESSLTSGNGQGLASFVAPANHMIIVGVKASF
jgi:TonB-linked SusC/RagA family outer membrane protein